MPLYDYYCEQNDQTVEVRHSMWEKLQTWQEVCERTAMDPGDTPGDAPVRCLPSRVHIAVPTSNSDLKQKGFTKLVRRDKGVYENVTATGKESRYFNAQDPRTLPNLKKKISD